MVKISNLPSDTSVDGSDLIPFVDVSAGTTEYATKDNLLGVTITGDGWAQFINTHSVATAYNAGNRSFTVDTSTDVSSFISPGMRYYATRDTVPATQCADLEASSSQYASKTSPTGITFTDDFTCEAWVKLESYGAVSEIISRYNGTSGWQLRVNADGSIYFGGFNASSANVSRVESYQSVPLSKWVHIAVQLDMSTFTATTTTSYVMIDGVNVPAFVTRGGTNPTALVQAGNLELGATNSGTLPFDGKLADVRVWSDKRLQAEIQDNMFGYPSDTTGLVGHWKLNGDFTDATTNNDLTASGGAVATNVDNPWNPIEYGIITAVSATDMQVFCPQGYGIPNETLTAPFYSTQASPFGFPRNKGLWVVETLVRTITPVVTAATTWVELLGGELITPVGSWTSGYKVRLMEIEDTTTSINALFLTLSKTTAAEDDYYATSIIYGRDNGTTGDQRIGSSAHKQKGLTVTTPTTLFINHYTEQASTEINVEGLIVFSECAYL